MIIKIALAGARHAHASDLVKLAKNTPGASFAGAWEEDAAARAAYAAKGISFNYASYEELLSDSEIGVVMICDYYGRRGELAIKALEAGKHVLADKPLCTSTDELYAITRLSAQNGLKVGCLLTARYSAATAAAKALINAGELGMVRSVSFTGQHPLMFGKRPGWYFEDRKHGGTINDIAIHGIDLLRYLTGFGVKEINTARTWNAYAKSSPAFRDSAQFMVMLKGGAGVIADVSYSSPDSFGYRMPTYWQFRVWCDRGMFEFNAEGDSVTVYKNGETEPVRIIGSKPQASSLSDLLAEIGGRQPEILSTNDVLASTRDVLMIQRFADEKLADKEG